MLKNYLFEEWRDIKGAEGTYQISNQGRVRSVDRIDANGAKRNGIILSQKVARSGYKTVSLYFNQRWHHPSVHRLVAEAFIPNPNNLPQVNHKDEDKTNNCVDNLEWCSAKYNTNYGLRNKKAGENISKANRGKPQPQRCKEIEKFDMDGNYITTYGSVGEAANSIGKPSSYISTCLIGKTKSCNGFIWRYKR